MAKKRFIALPDRLGLSSRLSLYDAKHQFVVGEPPSSDQMSYRPIIVNNQLVGYLGLKPVLDKEDALSINFFSNQKRYLLLIYALTLLSSLVAALLMCPNRKRLFFVLKIVQQHLQQTKSRKPDEISKFYNSILLVGLSRVSKLFSIRNKPL